MTTERGQRTYVITGAASGIGAATAALIISHGHCVLTVDRHDADICVDLAGDAGRSELVAEISTRCDGVVDAVIVAAGTANQRESDVSVNYFGAVATLAGLRPALARGTAPRAVAIASYAAILPHDDDLVTACLVGDEGAAIAAASSVRSSEIYASTKRALVRWVRQQAPTHDWAGQGIAINAVAPGIVRTPMTADLLADQTTAALLTAAVPMPYGGITEPAVVADLIAFLASDQARSITGQTVFIDGGADCVMRGDDVF